MLSSDHADILAYRQDPDGFCVRLYREIKAVYSSLYPDHLEDAATALKRLDQALHEGFSSEQLITKAKQASELTAQQFRPACAKFVRDFFWLREYVKPVLLRPMESPKPWDGPMPQRP
jgi:hypothetical protein